MKKRRSANTGSEQAPSEEGVAFNGNAAGMGNSWMQQRLNPSWAQPDRGLLSAAGFTGQSMQLPYRKEMEEEFQTDLSGVNAVRGESGAMGSLGASAFATGNLVAFTDASPDRSQVREEIIHLLQQSRGQGRGVSDPRSSSERSAKSGRNAGSGRDASIHRDEDHGSQEAAEFTLPPGVEHTVTAADMAAGGEEEVWTHIARTNGMMGSLLIAFNQHVLSVSEGSVPGPFAEVPALAEGVLLYIPSADDLAYAQCVAKAGTEEGAQKLYGELCASSNMEILRTARFRASGQRGKGYGNKGLGDEIAGPFLSPNDELAGASWKRSSMVDGQREYRVNWNATERGFWKCSLFLHDVVFQAGYKPDQTSNNHYQLAGRLHQSKMVEEVPVQQAGPGALWQRFGGTKSDESHNAILTSFVVVTPGEETDLWEFSILGAEQASAGESSRRHHMKQGTNETTSGKRIRFFRPLQRR
jgi:hypothetical protein